MSISEFFQRLGAPLHNIVWSWGAVAEDGTVILRCWMHELRKVDGKYQHEVLDLAYRNLNAPGYLERLNHIRLINDGANVRIVTVTDVDPINPQGNIRYYNSNALMIGTRIFTEGDKTYVECEGVEQLKNGYRVVG